MLTWRHVESGSTSEVSADFVGGRESKVGQFYSVAVIGNQNVLRLEVPVVDPDGMAKLNSIQKLEKDVLGKLIVSNEAAALGNVAEKITFGAVLNHDKCAVGTVQYAHERDHIGMMAGLIVHGNLSSLETLLTGIQSMFGKGLYGVQFVGVNVDGLVDHTVSTHTENGNEFESVGEDTT